MKKNLYHFEYFEIPPVDLFDSLKIHTRTVLVTKNFSWQSNPQHHRRNILDTPVSFTCLFCSHNGLYTHPIRAYERGLAMELLQLFNKMSSLGLRKRKTRALFILYFKKMTPLEAECLIYMLRITKANFSVKIYLDENDYDMIKQLLPFQYQILCDSINSIVYLNQDRNKSAKYDLKLPL